MTNNLTIISNNKKAINIKLRAMEQALNHAKKDIDLYFSVLAEMVNNHPIPTLKTKAWKHLVKQDKLQYILEDLITRIKLLAPQPSVIANSNRLNYRTIIRKVTELETEIKIFNETHYIVKRGYMLLTNQYVQRKSQFTVKVA